MESPILTVAFVIAATQFFKVQFSLAGKWALLCSFVVSLIVGLAPLASAALPAIKPWVDEVIIVFVLFVTASGSFDFLSQFRTAPAKE